MPIFYFDVYDGDSALHDDYGCEMASVAEAAGHAAAMLPDLARENLRSESSRDYAAFVRDRGGSLVFWAALRFRGERLAGSTMPQPAERGSLFDLIAESREARQQARTLSASIQAISSELFTIAQDVSRAPGGTRGPHPSACCADLCRAEAQAAVGSTCGSSHAASTQARTR